MSGDRNMNIDRRYPILDYPLPYHEGVVVEEDTEFQEFLTNLAERRRRGKIAEIVPLGALALLFAFGSVCILSRSLDRQAIVNQESEIYPLSLEMEDLN